MKTPNLILADWLRNDPQPEVCIDGIRYVAHRPPAWGRGGDALLLRGAC